MIPWFGDLPAFRRDPLDFFLARGTAAKGPFVKLAMGFAPIYLVTDPGRYDVIVTDNLFGDIITDLAAAVAGGIGLAASGNLDVSRTNPSMFEPVHGSAPDIAGQGKADPTAAVLSVAMLLEHIGESDAAQRVEAAVAADLLSRNVKQPGTTSEIGERLAKAAAG